MPAPSSPASDTKTGTTLAIQPDSTSKAYAPSVTRSNGASGTSSPTCSSRPPVMPRWGQGHGDDVTRSRERTDRGRRRRLTRGTSRRDLRGRTRRKQTRRGAAARRRYRAPTGFLDVAGRGMVGELERAAKRLVDELAAELRQTCSVPIETVLDAGKPVPFLSKLAESASRWSLVRTWRPCRPDDVRIRGRAPLSQRPSTLAIVPASWHPSRWRAPGCRPQR